MAQRCKIDMKLRNFQNKYLMRIVRNNKYLFECKIAATALCDFCAMQEESNAQLFWNALMCKRIGQNTNVLKR